jgi:hypothetical protein
MAWVLDLQAMDIYTEDTVQGNLHNAFEPPYPANFWYVTDTPDVTHDGALDVLPIGAFALTTELQEIRLPESLEEIGPEAFYGSAIRRVTIPNNQCTYYTTSFPPNCVVTGGHWIE